MEKYSEGWRHELKFLLPNRLIPHLREAFAQHVIYDAYCCASADNMYTVRSIYYDTKYLDFFFEKKDGNEVRKKLRVRTYDSFGDYDHAFIEIKRKHGWYGFKDRLKMPLGLISGALDLGNHNWEDAVPVYSNRRILKRMRELSTKITLEPNLLVTYEREAMVGAINPRNRVTFDQNLRSLKTSKLADIYSENSTPILQDEFVLELKFDEWMPTWMGQVITDFNLTVGSFSKYCHGVEVCWSSQELLGTASLNINHQEILKQEAAHG